MNTLLWIEWKKLVWDRKKWFFAGIILAYLLFYIVQAEGAAQQSEQLMLAFQKDMVEQFLCNIDSMEMELQNDYPEDVKERMKNILASSREEMKWQETIKKSMEDGNWRAELAARILVEQKLLEGIKSGEVISGRPQEESENNLALLEYLKKHDFQPQGNERFTVISYFCGSGIYLAKMLFPMLAVWCAYDIFLKEKKGRTSNFLFQQPYKRGQIYRAKVLTVLAFAILQVVLAVALCCVFLGITVPGGRMGYPVEAQTWMAGQIQIGSAFYVSAGYYLAQEGILLFMMLLSAAGAGVCISVFLKNDGTAMAAALGIGVIPYVAGMQSEAVLEKPEIWVLCLAAVAVLLVCGQLTIKKRVNI